MKNRLSTTRGLEKRQREDPARRGRGSKEGEDGLAETEKGSFTGAGARQAVERNGIAAGELYRFASSGETSIGQLRRKDQMGGGK